jgi:hypothetical protein
MYGYSVIYYIIEGGTACLDFGLRVGIPNMRQRHDAAA